MIPYQKMKSDGNLIYIITICSYFAEMKLRYTKIILNVAHFHIMMVLMTKNSSKGVHVINKLGRIGTGIPTAPVCRAGGKPSTLFPPRTRRADLEILNTFTFFFIEISSHPNFQLQ